MSRRWHLGGSIGILLLALVFAPISTGQVGKGAKPKAVPAPAVNDKNVKDAIEKGVAFLRKVQAGGDRQSIAAIYPTGVDTLVGLAMLEAGVGAKDEQIQQIAAAVRAQSGRLNKTYELALAILFLDRLADKGDEPLLRTYALRLVAGQNNKGGWGYSCPVLTRDEEDKLLAFLRKNQPLFDPLRPVEHAFLTPIGKPGGALPTPLPLPTAGSLDAPLDKSEKSLFLQVPVPKDDKTPARAPSSTDKDKKSLPPERSPAPPDSTKETKAPQANSSGQAESKAPGVAAPAAKTTDDSKSPPAALKDKQDNPVKKDGAAVAKAKKVNPAAWPAVQKFVNQELRPRGGLIDIDSFGDNSNTQFAMLGLWAARRHDVPMALSLAALDKRYRESQNADGTWQYSSMKDFGKGFPKDFPKDFPKFGGVPFPKGLAMGQGGMLNLGTPSMTCVGLLGLGISHGSFREAMRIEPKQVFVDPAIQKGMQAIGRTLRQNAGDPPNLYMLWSIERVAMLYNLKKIDQQDWYAWGAKSLLRYQQANGSWHTHGFHGSQETVDTAMAILFLTRSHLNRDLTDRLHGFILAGPK